MFDPNTQFLLDFLRTKLFFAGADPVSWAIYAVYAVAIAFSAYSAIRANALAKKASRINTNQRQTGSLYQIRAGAYPRRIIYGRHRVGAIDCFVTAYGEENEYISYILIWAEGPCHKVDKLLFDGKEVDLVPIDDENPGILVAAPGSPYEGLIRMESELGDQEFPLPHGQGIIPGWGSTDILKGCCYSWVELKFDEEAFPQGVPQIGAIIEGRKDVYDPRDDSYKYTNNAALCLAHYMTLDKLGPGLDYDTEIGETELIAAAYVCEEIVETPPTSANDTTGGSTYFTATSGTSGGLEFRYTFNGIIELDKSPDEIIERFRASMAGVTVYIGGRWRIYPGTYRTPTFTINQDLIVGPVKRKTRSSRLDRYNIVRGVYCGPTTNWVPTDFPARKNDQYITDDGGELPEDIDLLDSDSVYRSQRIAEILLRRSRYGREITVSCSVEAWRAQPGLPVYFDFPEIGFDNVPMDVVAVNLSIENKQIVVSLQLRETNAYIYQEGDMVLGTEGSSIDVPPPVPRPPTYTDLFDEVPASVQVDCKFRSAELELCGFDEFVATGEEPKKYRNRTVAGSLTVNRYVNASCVAAAYPGDGYQGGEFPVFIFQNETVLGWVVLRFNFFSWDGSQVLCSYTVVDADWVGVSPGAPVNNGSHPWFYNSPGGNGVANFTVVLGQDFSVSVHVQAVFGYGVGAWTYKAGENEHTDTWDIREEYDASCNFQQLAHNTSRAWPSGDFIQNPLPERATYVADGRPDLYYQPWFTLLVQLEPYYVETTTSPTLRRTTGLTCQPGTGYGAASMKASGYIDEELTVEDTEEAAITRFQNENPWEAINYETCGLYPSCETLEIECAQAEYEARGSGDLLFNYKDVLSSFIVSGLEEDKFHVIRIILDKIDIATGTVIPYAVTIEYTDTSDANGVIQFESAIPTYRGYRSRVRSVKAYTV